MGEGEGEGGAAWKHREETTLHPDSVSENKDNLFPSHSITHCTAGGNSRLGGRRKKTKTMRPEKLINILNVKKHREDVSIQEQNAL